MDEYDQVNTQKNLSKLDIWAMAFGCMVGWGAFVMPGVTFLPLAGPAGTIISMAIGLAVMLVIATSLSYLMMRSPGSGGIYSYAKEAFGRDHAFLCSWFLCLSYLTIVFLNSTALFVVIRTILGNAAHKGFSYSVAGNTVYLTEVALSAFALIGVGLLLLVAKTVLHRITTILAMILLVGVVVTAICCLPNALSRDVLCSFGFQGVNGGFAVFSLVVLAPWAFAGFEVTALCTAQFKFPIKKTKSVVFSAIIVAAAVYAAMALVGVSARPDGYESWIAYLSDLNSLNGVDAVPTFYAAKVTMGRFGLVVLTVTTLAAILTGIIEAYRAIVNVLSTMAEDKIISEYFSKQKVCVFFIMILAVLISLLGRNTLGWFVDLTSFGAVVAYAYMAAASYKIAKTESNYKIMAAGLAGTVISVIFGISQLVPRMVALEAMDCEAFLLLSLWSLLGFVFYWRTAKQSTITQYSDISIAGIALFAFLVYAALLWLGKMLYKKGSLDEVRSSMIIGGFILMLIFFVGLLVMQYIQTLVRRMHEATERDKIRVSEGNLARSQFLFNMSHDIRTPMNAILGYTTLALKEPDHLLRDYLVKIDKSSRQLISILNDILEMSRMENGGLELEYNPIDLRLLFEELDDLYAEQMAQKHLAFSMHTSQIRNQYVWCDRKNLKRILMNIISNAYKFTPEDGTITASIYEADSSDEEYGSYEIRVRDSGIGMSKEFVAKMFNAFERERTSTASGMEGTGLGLAITKRIVDLMGGTIEVFTSPGNGTELVIHLKLRLAAVSDVQKENTVATISTENAHDFTGKRLLLVEDNEVNMEIAQMLLEQMGFDVETAANGKIAVEMVRASQPGHYDAILMDIQMPVMDGYAATKEIRALKNPAVANIPILAMTANTFPEDISAAKSAGMQAHIAKPVEVDNLKKELGLVLKS